MSEPAPTADSAEEFAGSLVSKSFGWVSSEAKNWSEHGVTFCIFWSGWIGKGKGNLGWILDGTAVLQSSNVTCGDELNMSNSRCSGILALAVLNLYGASLPYRGDIPLN